MLSVSADIDLRLVLGGDRTATVAVTLGYVSDQPFTVRAQFHTSEGDIVWVFGRDLLEEGLRAPTGDGDVAVWPSDSHGHRVLCLSLASPSGSALLEADLRDIGAFLDQTYAAVPMGTESENLDLDAALAVLLSDGTSPHF